MFWSEFKKNVKVTDAKITLSIYQVHLFFTKLSLAFIVLMVEIQKHRLKKE